MDSTAASKAQLTVAGDVVHLSVSPRWLAGLPASAFPVVIDPFFTPPTGLPTQVFSANDFGNTLTGVMQIGRDGAGRNWRGGAFIPAPTLPSVGPTGQPWQLSEAQFTAVSGINLVNAPVYGLSGIDNFGFPGRAPLLFIQPAAGGVVADSTRGNQPFLSYIKSRTNGWWFGFGSPSQVGPPGTLATFDPSQVTLDLVYEQQPSPTRITSPADRSVVTTTTPTLTAAPVSGEDDVFYDFQISTSSDGMGTVIDSGWLDQTSWAVPPGSLQDGVTYFAKVLTSIDYWIDVINPGATTPTSSPPSVFQVKQRLGNGGPSPTDTIGSPPGSTNIPSQGAPSPGVSPSSERVNMVTGDLAVAVGTPSMQTVSGPAGVSLTYNSLASSKSKGGNYGLTARYYVDSGSHTFAGATVGQRIEAAVNARWSSGQPPIGGLNDRAAQFLVRWTGVLSLPVGTWRLGGLTTGGMRIYINGSTTPTYDDWAGTASAIDPAFGSATLSGGQQYQIEVDTWVQTTGGAQAGVQLWAKNTAITDPNTVSAWVVPGTWLTPVAMGVPPGWNLVAKAASALWIHADDEGNQVVLQGASGQKVSFFRMPGGLYQSQPGNHDYLSVDGNRHLQLSTAENQLYTFNADGSLASMTTIADDLHPAALQYTYSGTPALLRMMTDPVSGRSINLSYGGDSACPISDPAPAGMLCKISFWDGTVRTFGYNSNGQIALVNAPGGQTTLLGYDSDNRLAGIRDALAVDYVAAGGQAGAAVGCPAGTSGLSVTPVDTQICYDNAGRVATITQPAPTPGAPAPGGLRPSRTYTYASDHTDVSIAGFSPSSGYAARTAYDAQGRIIQQSDSAGHVTTTVWGTATAPNSYCVATAACGTDQPLVTANPAGLQTSMAYDRSGNVTDAYGPAPLACFSGGWPNGVTPIAPVVGYAPVANPQGTAGCGVATIPHTHSGYDEGVTGLAASFWSNGQAAGAVAKHSLGAGGTQPAGLCQNTTDTLCAHWDAGAPPVSSDTSGHWSLRLTGTINLVHPCLCDFTIWTSQKITLSIDANTVLTYDPAQDPNGVPGRTIEISTDGGIGRAPGVHPIELDFQGSATQLNEFAIIYTVRDEHEQQIESGVVPNSILDPGYGLKTSTTDPDGHTTTTSYAAANLGPQYGLPTAITVGAGTSAALTTTTAYEAPSPSSYLRKTSSTLPAGNATTYTYYTGTAGPLAAVCGVAANTPQGGLLQAQTDPASASGEAAREQQFVYDAAGRLVGRRVGPSTSISTVPWQCTSYDSRGRPISETWPAFNGAPARTVTFTYDLGRNPLAASVADGNGTITSTVDLLGRVSSYTDSTGKTTATTYNQAGQTILTSGPQGTIANTYDSNSGALATVSVNSSLMATTHYDTATGRLASVTYANGTAGTVGYDAFGAQNSLVFTNTASGILIAGNKTTRSPGGRITSELQDINGTSLTNPNPAGPDAADYAYDGAGRLTSAYYAGALATYSYAVNAAGDNCANPSQGANTNRTNVTITPTGGNPSNTHYCYNAADQLVASISGGTAATNYSYNDHGDQTTDNGVTYTWDAADRVTTSTANGVATASTYDPLDRLIQSATTGTGSTVRYAYSGYTEAPAAVLDTDNNVLQQFVGLPGGVTVILQSPGATWSYTNLQGDTTATANNAGIRIGGPVTYDPWGNLSSGEKPIATISGPNTLGGYAASGKLTNSITGTILLGARTFNPSEARFLSVDPVDGGCANAYTYAFGDPLNHSDLTGSDTLLDSEFHHGSCGDAWATLWETDDGDFRVDYGFDLYTTIFGLKIPLLGVHGAAVLTWQGDDTDAQVHIDTVSFPGSKWSSSTTIGYDDEGEGSGYALGHTIDVSVQLLAEIGLGPCFSPSFHLHG
ncbi:MAG: hypothetical protein J2P17_04190 [Mycobacterium sp.]|nr:hypothetical protein [Mycobacterium sp.]